MKQNRKQLKAMAREAMKQSKPSFALVTFVFLLLVTIIPFSINSLLSSNVSLLDAGLLATTEGAANAGSYLFGTGMLGLFLSLLISLFTTVIHFGHTLWSLRCFRREECTLGSLVEGFATAPHVILVMVLSLLMQFTQLFFWTILFTIILPMLFSILTASWMLVILISGIGMFAITMMIMLRFSFVHHVMADNPTMGAIKTISTATALTRNRLGELFYLNLSFFWWYLLAIVIDITASFVYVAVTGNMIDLAVLSSSQDALLALQDVMLSPASQWISMIVAIPLSLWLTPYTSTTISGFYDHLVGTNADMLTGS